MSKKIMNILLTSLFTYLAFFGLGEFGLFLWEDCCFVSWSPVITMDKKVASSEPI
jgi:hypothetical protein